MRDYQKDLKALRERIAQRREDMAVLESLRRQEEACRREVEARTAQWNREERDVEKLETLSFAAILSALRGSKDEDIDREKAEAYAARLRLQEAERQLREIQEEILDRQRRIQENENCQRQYEALLREKETELRKSDPVLAEKLMDLERRELELTAQRKELREAFSAGEQAVFHLNAALGQLNKAESWGTWDVFGGGVLTDMMKYSRLDGAQQQMRHLQSALRRYQAELADVAQTAEFNLQMDGFTWTMDVWFDNLFADWAVLKHIRGSQEELGHILRRVDRIQSGLDLELQAVDAELEELKSQRDELVQTA